MDIVFTLFVVALVVFAALAICLRKWRSVIATVMTVAVVIAVGVLMWVHAQDKQMAPLPNITNSRPMG